MTEKEAYDTAREAMREVLDRPEHTGDHEEHLLRYLSGVVYHEHEEEARDKRKHRTEEGRR